MESGGSKTNVVFDYRALRLLMGLIALLLPAAVTWIATMPLSSISASYYSESRDVFVGSLFVVGAFLWAYNGHDATQAVASKLASVGAIIVALVPTSCSECESSLASMFHYGAAALLFTMLAYFCLGPFREKTRGQGGKKGRRAAIYLACGLTMIGAMLGILLANLWFPEDQLTAWRVVYWGETIALAAFGVAWIVAGKYLPILVDRDEALNLFESR
ncbi:MAG: hypothetical protein ACWA5Q_06705 [bacterium]